MAATILGMLGKSLISMLMSLATEAFFKDVILMLAEKGAESTKTKFDDKLIERIKKALEEEDA